MNPMLRQLARDLWDFCLPPCCVGCGAATDVSPFLCSGCAGQLDTLADAPSCRQCASPLSLADAPCPHCRDLGMPHYDRVVALGRFEEPLKSLIHQLKYRRQWAIADRLADRLTVVPAAQTLLAEAECIVPVPLHRLRHLARGYNQARLVAARLSKYSGLPLARPAVRRRNTETQTHLHSTKLRFNNLRDAFRLIDSRCVRDKRVLVVDDVMTSGATLQTLARTLRAAKPRSLDAIVLAVADPKGRAFERV